MTEPECQMFGHNIRRDGLCQYCGEAETPWTRAEITYTDFGSRTRFYP